MMTEVDYLISTNLSKFDGYQSKKGNKGYVKAYVANLWNTSLENEYKFDEDQFQLFVNLLNSILIHERYCLERAFQRIRIKGGMCKPCCVGNLVKNTVEYLYNLTW